MSQQLCTSAPSCVLKFGLLWCVAGGQVTPPVKHVPLGVQPATTKSFSPAPAHVAPDEDAPDLRTPQGVDLLRARLEDPDWRVRVRALGVMACRHVDDVIVGAPAEVTRDLIATFDVRAVVAESEEARERDDAPAAENAEGAPRERRNDAEEDALSSSVRVRTDDGDPNGLAKALGLFRSVPPLAAAAPANGADRLTRSEIVRRVAAARAAYEARNARKNQSEARYYEQKSNRTIELAREA